MNMEAVLPLNFYCRNARLCLKKAAFSKKSQLYADELRHLRKFDALISSTIPCHPLYEERKGDKQIVELQDFLPLLFHRILDAKMEHFSVGVQTALEGAAMAESKCGALGAELVKVFRMLASSRRESPLKMQEGDDNNESGSRADNRKQQQQQRPDNGAGIKLKAPMSLAACSYCKKPNPKGGECGCRNKEAKDGNVRLGQPEIPPTDSKQMQDPRPDGSSRIRLKHSIEPHREHGSSEMRAVEAGEQPIVMDKFDSAKEGGKNSQMGTFKLESGKPQMNSSHRSSPGPNPRLPKRGDTL